MSTPTHISVSDLTGIVRNATRKLGFSDADGEIVTEIIVDSDLHGVHSHGIRFFSTQVAQLQNGKVNVDARPHIAVDNKAAVVIDGGHGFGPVTCRFATDLAISRAREYGVAAVTMRDSSHWGCPSYYGRLAASEGVVMIAASNTGIANMPLWGSGEQSVGNNPIVIAVPRADGPAWVLDISMQVAAWGKLALFRDAGERLPGAWGFDADHQPTDDPGAIIDSGLIRPMGDHKGSGLAVMVEALTAGLSASLHSGNAPERTGDDARQYKSQFFLALDPAFFGGIEGLERMTSSFTRQTADLKPVEGFESVRLPGSGAVESRRRIEAEGVPLTPTIRKAIDVLRALDSEETPQ